MGTENWNVKHRPFTHSCCTISLICWNRGILHL